jgi:hypothetical protein
MPDDAPMAATAILPLLHVPPAEASLKTEVAPAHTPVVPDMAATAEKTVIVDVA